MLSAIPSSAYAKHVDGGIHYRPNATHEFPSDDTSRHRQGIWKTIAWIPETVNAARLCPRAASSKRVMTALQAPLISKRLIQVRFMSAHVKRVIETIANRKRNRASEKKEGQET
jgi:hypothetical protein